MEYEGAARRRRQERETLASCITCERIEDWRKSLRSNHCDERQRQEVDTNVLVARIHEFRLMSQLGVYCRAEANRTKKQRKVDRQAGSRQISSSNLPELMACPDSDSQAFRQPICI